MHFIHIADCHLGGWREEKLHQLNLESFRYVIHYTLEHKADFLLIAGDLFNTSLPPMDVLKETTKLLKQVSDAGIGIYAIAGSHDYSPTGKTMLAVLEHAGLLVNVLKGKVIEGKLHLRFTVDPKTGAKITGILGKRGLLDKYYYEALDREALEQEKGFKIFMFHTTVDELKPKDLSTMESIPLSFFPKGFDYYAGGHVHIRKEFSHPSYQHVWYPGPVFPNNFSELEKLGSGSFIEYKDGRVMLHKIPTRPVITFAYDCDKKSASHVKAAMETWLQDQDVKDALVLLRLFGTLSSGTVKDLRLSDFIATLMRKGAYVVLRNTAQLTTQQLETVHVAVQDKEQLENALIKEHLGHYKGFLSVEQEHLFMKELMKLFQEGKKEGETKETFEQRLEEQADALLQAYVFGNEKTKTSF